MQESRASVVTRTSMFVTRDVSQLLTSPLKVMQRLLQSESPLAQKTLDRSVTCETSHVLIGPYVASAFAALVQ